MRKLLSLSKNIICSNLTHLSRPYKLTYAVTYRCNSRCKICNIWKQRKFDELTLGEVEKFFTKNNYFNWIDITGGEVFLRPNFVEIIKTIIKTQKNLYLLHLPTNGILTNKIVKDIRSILALKPNKFIITCSIDGPPKVHDRLRGIRNNWKQTVQTYKSLKGIHNNRFQVYFGVTLSGYNAHLINETFRSLQNEIPDLSQNDLHFNIAHHSNHYYGNTSTALGNTVDIARKINDFNKTKRIQWDGVSLLERIFQGLIPKYLTTKKTPIPCKALDSSFFLNPNGEIFPCTMWNFPLGNVRDIHYDLKTLWKSKIAGQTRHVIDLKKCPNCWTPCEAYQSILGNLSQWHYVQ